MFMGENYLITVHDSPIPELDDAAVRWRRNAAMIVAERRRVHNLPGTRALTGSKSGAAKASNAAACPGEACR